MPVNTTNVSLAGGSGSPATAGSIRGEFPKSPNTNPTSLSQFYRGGPNVPITQGDAGYGIIPTSGQISFGPFRNQTKVINFGDPGWGLFLVAVESVAQNIARTEINFAPNGSINTTGSVALVNSSTTMDPLPPDQWYNPITIGIGSSYWIRIIQTSSLGSATSIGGTTLNTWVSLVSGANRFMEIQVGGGAAEYTYSIEFASDSAGSNIVTSGQLSLLVDTT
jgi:hypothetical protein